MAENEKPITFVARVEKKFRIFIPKTVREILEIDEGDYVEIIIKRVKRSAKISRRI